MNSDPGSLAGLHDIVLAPPPGWWPLAGGWYVLGLLLIVLISWWGWGHWQRYRANRYRRAALLELQAIEQADDAGAIGALPALLKRTAMQVWPRQEVAALSQQAWCLFLDRHCPGEPFQGRAGELLLMLAYQPGRVEHKERQLLLEASRTWIRRHRAEPC